MSLNLDAIRNKLNSLNATDGSNNRKNNIFKPEIGKTQVRIVPYQFNKENPFIEGFFHYGLGNRTYMSPTTYGEADPIVEFAAQLKQTGNREDWQLGRKMEPKMRVYLPVIVRGKESEGVKFWGFGKTVYQQLMNFMVDPDYGDITDLRTGRDIVITYTAASGAGNYPTTEILVKPNQTPATEDKAIAETIINGQTNFYEVFTKSSYDDLKVALEGYLNQGEEEPAGGEEISVSNGTVESTPAPTSPSAGVASAFDNLFNE